MLESGRLFCACVKSKKKIGGCIDFDSFICCQAHLYVTPSPGIVVRGGTPTQNTCLNWFTEKEKLKLLIHTKPPRFTFRFFITWAGGGGASEDNFAGKFSAFRLVTKFFPTIFFCAIGGNSCSCILHGSSSQVFLRCYRHSVCL